MAAARPPDERSCDDLVRDAHGIVAARRSCTLDLDCQVTAPACPGGFACGAAVRGSDLAQVNAALTSISERYEAQCKQCAQKEVQCLPPNPVCHEGQCTHVPRQAECDKLEHKAQALMLAHDACTSDSDCVFASSGNGCPMAIGCGATINKAHDKVFSAEARSLSKTFYEYCGQCTAMVAECQASTPLCENGRCARRSSDANTPRSCEELETAAHELIEMRNDCATDADCTLVRSEGGCAQPLACPTPVAKLSADTFAQEAVGLSHAYEAQCGRCARTATTCRDREPVCRAGRCELKGVKR